MRLYGRAWPRRARGRRRRGGGRVTWRLRAQYLRRSGSGQALAFARDATRPWSSRPLRRRSRPSSSRCPRRRPVQREAVDRSRPCAFEQLLDRLLVVLHERLAEQRDLGEELVDARPRPSCRRCSRACPTRRRAPRAILRSLLDRVGGRLVLRRAYVRLGAGDVHREVLGRASRRRRSTSTSTPILAPPCTYERELARRLARARSGAR